MKINNVVTEGDYLIAKFVDTNTNSYYTQKIGVEQFDEIIKVSDIAPMKAFLENFEMYRMVENIDKKDEVNYLRILPPLDPVSVTDDVLLIEGQFVGNTTRIIDNAIQLLFAHKIVELDSDNTDRSPSYLLQVVRKRLKYEHENKFTLNCKEISEDITIAWLVFNV